MGCRIFEPSGALIGCRYWVGRNDIIGTDDGEKARRMTVANCMLVRSDKSLAFSKE